MPPDELLKYLLDIESVIDEIEGVIEHCGHDFQKFEEDFMAVRTVERDLSIIGEAVNHISKEFPKVEFSSIEHIVGLRNLLIHSYDNVDQGVLWGIVKKDIPVLKEEVKSVKEKGV
jgi:uncharacterized protein with HEPN domain